MIFENFKNTSKLIFYTLFFVFYSCNEYDSAVLNPPNPNTFHVKSFIIDSNSSSSYRNSDFNAADSPRSYVGIVDEYSESSLLIKIDKDLIANDDACYENNPDFNDLTLNLFLKTNLTEIFHSSNTYTVEENTIQNDSGYSLNEECNETGPIYNWIYDDLTEQDCIAQQNGASWNSEIDENCGYLNQSEVFDGCCKYWGCIACCNSSLNTDSYNINNIINAYILDSDNSALQNYEENSNNNHDTSWIDDSIEENLNVRLNNSFRLTVDLYEYLLDQGYGDLCSLDYDLFILIKLNPNFSNLYEEKYIEFFSSEDTSPSYYYYKPYVVINYDELTDVNQEQIKYSVDNNIIDFNASLTTTDISYSINNTDSINIVAFSNSQNYPTDTDCYCYQVIEENNCNICSDCSWNNGNCFYNVEVNQAQLSPIIDAGFSEELFNFDITIDTDYLNMIELKDTLDDIIKFKFKNVSFIFQDMDPMNDDWHDYGNDGCDDVLEDGEGGCFSLQEETVYDIIENSDPNSDNYDINTNIEGTQNNGVYDVGEGIESNFNFDAGELFDDFGFDFCPNEYEDGFGNCLCDVNLIDDCQNINIEQIVFNADGFENNEIYDEGEYFDSNLDTGPDGCFSENEDGEGYCIQDGDQQVYHPVSNPDPNGDDYSLDPSEDNWNDFGEDGCTDELENGSNGCLNSEDIPVYDIDTNPDPNGDNYDVDNNANGTEGNNNYEFGEGLEDNLQYDFGEYWIDAGVDQLFDIHEPGYDSELNPDPHGDNYDEITNPTGTELSGAYEVGEWYFDDGVDQLDNNNEYNIGYDEAGKEINGKYDPGEDFSQYDIGADICPNEYEDGLGACLCDYINYLNNENDFSCDNINPIYDSENNPDPNKDDLNEDPNQDDLVEFENNQVWDFLDYGVDACENEFEDGNGGCLSLEDPPVYNENNSDPNGDNYDEINNPLGTENNSILDYNFTANTFWENGYGEKFETFYDYGDGELTENEQINFTNYYYGSYAPVSLTDLFYIDTINDLEIDESYDGQKTNNPDKNVFLWINSVTKTSDNQYNVSVYLETYIDIIAYEIHLYHDHFQYSDEIMEEKLTGLWPYEDNINNDGEKYIFDASVYEFDTDLCNPNAEGLCSNLSDLLLTYGQGIKSMLRFKDSNDKYFSEFMEELKNSNQFTIFSDEYTKLLLYFDLSEGSLHNVDEYTEIKLEYFDEVDNEYKVFPIYNQTVTINDEYISIPIVYLMQSYLVGDLNIFDNPFQILLSGSSNRFNFSRISIDPENSRIEVFYSE